MSTAKTIAAFCGSKEGKNPLYARDAALLGQLIGKNGYDLIYGGSQFGIMGAVANNALSHGAKVTGVLPEVLISWEQQHDGITELIITKDMHERKKLLFEKADVGIILPGGVGTLDELFEMVTWNQLSIHDKKIYILNTDGFYDNLIAHLQRMEQDGFLYEQSSKMITVFAEPNALMEEIKKNIQ